MTKSKPEPLDSMRVGGHEYSVEFLDLYGEANCEDAGSVDCAECRMLINAKMSESRQEETIIHELLEVACFHMGVSPREGFQFTHDHLSTLSEILYQSLKDNKGWWAK